MSQFVKVEYNITDVLPEKKEKLKRLGSARKTKLNEVVSSKTTRPPVVTPQPSPRREYKEPDTNTIGSPAKLLKPSTTVPKRSDPTTKRKPPDEPWTYSAKCPDRDALILEQDLNVTAFRHRYPTVYDVSNETKAPHFNKQAPKVDPTAQRTRPLPKTSGNVLNSSLPFYPFLNENHGIHPVRWNVMTVDKDDPDRCKPELNKPGKNHTDFDKSFNNCLTSRSRDQVNIVNGKLL